MSRICSNYSRNLIFSENLNGLKSLWSAPCLVAMSLRAQPTWDELLGRQEQKVASSKVWNVEHDLGDLTIDGTHYYLPVRSLSIH
jgi:hypothetical protein